MPLFIDKIMSSLLQIAVFAVVPFIWWLITARKRQKFTEWVGLKKIEGGRKTLTAVIATSAAFILSGALTLCLMRGAETAVSEFAGLRTAAVPAIIVYAVFNTAFPEELLFRGFILKRLANKLGFITADFIQALLFGLLHGVMFFPLLGTVKAIFIILFTGSVAWLMGYVNERVSNGSIIPSWIIHAASNLFSGICSAFSLL